MDTLNIKQGERVLQVGAGTGYYTAILAELVGARGRIHAVEFEKQLAKKTKVNPTPWPQVTVTHGDATTTDVGEIDIVVVFAGGTHPAQTWLDRLAP